MICQSKWKLTYAIAYKVMRRGMFGDKPYDVVIYSYFDSEKAEEMCRFLNAGVTIDPKPYYIRPVEVVR